MKLQILSLTLLASLFVSSCSTSNVINVGDNTYAVATENGFSSMQARKQALSSAENHCVNRGQIMVPVKTSLKTDPDKAGEQFAQQSLVFRCDDAGRLDQTGSNAQANEGLKLLSEETAKDHAFWKREDMLDGDYY